jgi:hypothetical protein
VILLGCLFGKHGRMVMCSVLAFVLIFYQNHLWTMEQLQQIFDNAVEAVMQASGLDFDALANCRSERCVVARVVLVDVLMELGMSEGDIAFLSGMSQQRVNSLKNSARYRLKGLAARVMREEVRKSVSLPIAENNR